MCVPLRLSLARSLAFSPALSLSLPIYIYIPLALSLPLSLSPSVFRVDWVEFGCSVVCGLFCVSVQKTIAISTIYQFQQEA